jgi:hypothetical protein
LEEVQVEPMLYLKTTGEKKKSKTENFRKSTGSGIEGIMPEKINKAQLLQIRKKIRIENKKRQRKIIIFSAVIMVLFMIIFWKVMF